MWINIWKRLAATFARLGDRIRARPAESARPAPTVSLKAAPALRMEVHSRYDKFISAQIAQTGEWEPFETELVQRFLQPGDVFVDIGANIGWYTIIAASRVGARGRVYAFEPARENFELAARNVALNGLRNVTLERLAVGDRPGSASLFLSDDNLGDHRLFAVDDRRSSETVAVTSLDTYFADKAGPLRLVKMDTQGSEARIFAGITPEFIRERDIAGFIVEYWPHGLAGSGSCAEALIGRLAALDLRCYVIQEEFRGLEPIDLAAPLDLAAARLRAHGDSPPDEEQFVNFLALVPSKPTPPWVQDFIRSPNAPG